MLAMSAIRNNDRVGALMFTDRIEHVVPPRKGTPARAAPDSRPARRSSRRARRTDIGGAIEYLNKMLSHKAIIFLVSDFLGRDVERPLKLLAQRHDVVAVTVEDPSERALPDIGLVRFVDPETGATLDVDTSDPARARAVRRCACATSARARDASAAPPGDRRDPGAHGSRASWIRCSDSSGGARRGGGR